MSDVKIASLKLFKEDILVKEYPIEKVMSSIIDVVKGDEQKEKLNYFEVLKVADAVTDVSASSPVKTVANAASIVRRSNTRSIAL